MPNSRPRNNDGTSSASNNFEAYQVRQQRLECFEQTVDALRELWEPRLEALAKRFGKNMDVTPIQERGRRAVSMEFGSNLARILLRFAVSPDADARKLVVTYDVEILPVLMKFDSHRELELPLDAVDKAQLAQWLDDRIVDFVHTYLSLHENEYYLKDTDGRGSDRQGAIPELCGSGNAGT